MMPWRADAASNLSIQRHRRFQGHKGQAGADVLRKALVQASGLVLQETDFDFDSGRAQLLKASSGYQRIGIFHAADDARNSGGDYRVGAGPVRPVCEQGSRLRYRVLPRASGPACSMASTSACFISA